MSKQPSLFNLDVIRKARVKTQTEYEDTLLSALDTVWAILNDISNIEYEDVAGVDIRCDNYDVKVKNGEVKDTDFGTMRQRTITIKRVVSVEAMSEVDGEAESEDEHKGSIESVTLSSGNRSVTLTPETAKRAARALKKAA